MERRCRKSRRRLSSGASSSSRPRSMTITRSQIVSISPVSWEVSSTVVPSARESAPRWSRSAALAVTSSPMVGSSSSSTPGPCSRDGGDLAADALAEGELGDRPVQQRRRYRRWRSAAPAAPDAPAARCRRSGAAARSCCARASVYQSCERWPKTMPMRRASWRRWCQGTQPATSASPALGRRMPVSILSVVDLPAPLGPMKATRSPGAMAKEMSLDGRQLDHRPRARTAAPSAHLLPARLAAGLRTRKLLLNPSTSIAAMIRSPSQLRTHKEKAPPVVPGGAFGLSRCRSELPHAEDPRPAGHGRKGFNNHRVQDLAHGLKLGEVAGLVKADAGAAAGPPAPAAITSAAAAASEGARKLPVSA